MAIKYIDELNLNEKRVFIRVDFNVSLDEAGEIADDTRIRASLSTIRYALGCKAKVILASHLGRPKGKVVPKYSMKNVGKRLAALLEDVDVILPEDCVGDAVKKLAMDMLPGQVMLLENLRFHPEEEANDEAFSKQLASVAEVYVNDAFGTAHRAHASTFGMVKFVEQKGAGFLMRTEIASLSKLTNNPARPFIAILGGAKISDKIGVIDNLLNLCDGILIGGGMAFTFLAAKGYDIGKSIVETDRIHTAKRILERAETRGIPIELPTDNIVAEQCAATAKTHTAKNSEIKGGMMGLDIGPQTILKYCGIIEKAKTIFWNGPMGVFELAPFSNGTGKVAQAIAKSKSISIVGGGDSVAAIKKFGLADKITHISTGGGASLEFIEGKKLPGITALEA